MLGAINGAYVNRVVLNGRGSESLIVADAFLVQADATAVSAGAVLAAAHSHSVADHVLSGAGLTAIMALSSMTQAGHVITAAGAAVAGASMTAAQAVQAVASGGVLLVGGSTAAVAGGDALLSDLVAAIGGGANLMQADHVFTGSGAVSVAAALEALQSGVLLSDGSVLVASMAELTHDDHTLRVTFKPYILRKPLGARVESSPHGLPAVLVRRIGGSRLTLH